VKAFFGQSGQISKVGEVSKLERNQHGHEKLFTSDADMMPGIPEEIAHLSYLKGHSLTTQSNKLINSGEWVKYNTNDVRN
jgi:hypothetical protein